MGLLEQKKEIESKLHFYTHDGERKHLAAWVCESDGSLRVDSMYVETKEEGKALCQWYLSVCDEL